MYSAAVHPGEVRRRVHRTSFSQIQDCLQPMKEFHILGLRQGSSQTRSVVPGEDKTAPLLRLGHTDIVASRERLQYLWPPT